MLQVSIRLISEPKANSLGTLFGFQIFLFFPVGTVPKRAELDAKALREQDNCGRNPSKGKGGKVGRVRVWTEENKGLGRKKGCATGTGEELKPLSEKSRLKGSLHWEVTGLLKTKRFPSPESRKIITEADRK